MRASRIAVLMGVASVALAGGDAPKVCSTTPIEAETTTLELISFQRDGVELALPRADALSITSQLVFEPITDPKQLAGGSHSGTRAVLLDERDGGVRTIVFEPVTR